MERKRYENTRKERKFEWKEGVSFWVEKGISKYTVKIFYKGEEVGNSVLRRDKGGNSYKVENVDIKADKRNIKLGSNLVEEINHFIKSIEILAYLIEQVRPDKKKNIYKNHGWQKDPDVKDGYKLDARKK